MGDKNSTKITKVDSAVVQYLVNRTAMWGLTRSLEAHAVDSTLKNIHAGDEESSGTSGEGSSFKQQIEIPLAVSRKRHTRSLIRVYRR